MNLFKRITLVGLILAISIPQFSNPLTFQGIKNGIKVATLFAGAAVTTYVMGRVSSYALFELAKSRFNKDINYFQNNNYVALKTSIQGHYNQKINTININANKLINLYPLLSYKKDLDWYINRLWYLQIFYLGTSTRTEIQRIINCLTDLRKLIVSSDEYTEEVHKYYSKSKQL